VRALRQPLDHLRNYALHRGAVAPSCMLHVAQRVRCISVTALRALTVRSRSSSCHSVSSVACRRSTATSTNRTAGTAARVLPPQTIAAHSMQRNLSEETIRPRSALSSTAFFRLTRLITIRNRHMSLLDSLGNTGSRRIAASTALLPQPKCSGDYCAVVPHVCGSYSGVAIGWMEVGGG
jgi:hypothetical protein